MILTTLALLCQCVFEFGPKARVHLTKLGIRGFRNLKNADSEYQPGLHLFIGENGQGKTNLIEAIYVLLKGRTFRNSHLEHLVQKPSENAFLLNASVLSEEGKVKDQLDLKFFLGRKNIHLNGKPVSSEKIIQRFPLVLFSPESLSALKEGPDQRRQLIDELVESTPEFGFNLVADFKKCLRSRNKILKEYSDGKTSLEKTDLWLESINPSFLKIATELTHARIVSIKKVEALVSRFFREITHMLNVEISVDYVISEQRANDFTTPQILDALAQRMGQLRSAEIGTGTSLIGPHKHEIRFLFDRNDSRFFCSQGQQRALILAFKIAQIVYHRQTQKVQPILLLDDVLSELDLEKKHYLLGLLREQGENSQIFITTTEDTIPPELEREKLSVYRVKNGVIQLEC